MLIQSFDGRIGILIVFSTRIDCIQSIPGGSGGSQLCIILLEIYIKLSELPPTVCWPQAASPFVIEVRPRYFDNKPGDCRQPGYWWRVYGVHTVIL